MYSECVEGAGHQGISDTDLHSRLFAKYYMKILPRIFFSRGAEHNGMPGRSCVTSEK